MSSLLLIRHGQASLLSDNYDQLSPLGERQASVLGEALASRGIEPHRVVSGPRERQQRTAEISLQTWAARTQSSVPSIETLHALDEMEFDQVVKHSFVELCELEPRVGALIEQILGSQDASARMRAMSEAFRLALPLWMRGAIGSSKFESWRDFCSRVQSALESLTHMHDNAQRVRGVTLAFTSAGTIGTLLRTILRLDDEATSAIILQVRNASITECVFRENEVSLVGFNSIHHFAHDSGLETRI